MKVDLQIDFDVRTMDQVNYVSLSIFLSFFLYVLTSVEDIRRGSVYKCKRGVS